MTRSGHGKAQIRSGVRLHSTHRILVINAGLGGALRTKTYPLVARRLDIRRTPLLFRSSFTIA